MGNNMSSTDARPSISTPRTPEEEIFDSTGASTPLREDDITEIGYPDDLMDINNASTSELIKQASQPSIDDIITEDGILCSMLSFLTLREAVGTSVLSPRWRRVWNHLPDLKFGAANMFDNNTVSLLYGDDSPLTMQEKDDLLEEMTDQFISCVDAVIRQLQGRSGVNEFIIRYFLHEVHSHHLDEWVRLAISSKAKVLALHLNQAFTWDFDGEKYNFPCHLLGSSSNVENLILASCSLRPPYKFDGLSHLKNLTLYDVDITEEDITSILSNCYNLEYLKLQVIPRLVSLHIPHSLSRFRTFLAKECDQLRGEIEITSLNLQHLGYTGYPVDFICRQSPLLLDACITFRTEVWEPNMDFYLNKLSRNLPQLRYLSCTILGDNKVPDLRKGSASFKHLTVLDWCWQVSVNKMSLLHLTTLLDATPFLEELNLCLWAEIPKDKAPKRLEKLRETIPKHPHARLNTIQFMGFKWNKWHVQFTLYFLKNAPQLQTIKIMNGERGLQQSTMKKLRKELPAEVKLLLVYNYL